MSGPLGSVPSSRTKQKKLTKVPREGDHSSSALSTLLPEQQAAHSLDEVTISCRHGHCNENGIRETQSSLGTGQFPLPFANAAHPLARTPQTVPKCLVCFSGAQ